MQASAPWQHQGMEPCCPVSSQQVEGMHVGAGVRDSEPARCHRCTLDMTKQRKKGSAAGELQRRESEAAAAVEQPQDSRHLLMWQLR